MQLSEWRRTAPNNNCLAQQVLDVLVPLLVDMGSDEDPDCWVNWGDDPEFRYSILAPTVAGLIVIAVRIGGAEGARATSKLVRWSKVQVGEFSIDSSGAHRIVAVQVEGIVLKGTDEETRRISEFVRLLLAAIDGRAFQPAGQVVVAMPAEVTPKASSGKARAAAEPAAEPDGGPAREAASEPQAEAVSGKKGKTARARQPQAEAEGAPEPAPVAENPALEAAAPADGEWVAPHPVHAAPAPAPVQADLPISPAPGTPAAPAAPVPVAPAAAPAAPAAAPAAPAAAPAAPVAAPGIPPVPPTAPAGPRELGSVWEVPAPPVETVQRPAKPVRNWRP